LVIVSWKYDPDANGGLPSSAVLAEMEAFETAVLDASEAGAWGHGVAVVTTAGVREWRFYTGGAQDFMLEFSHSLSGMGPFPIELTAYDDPDWNALRELM